MDFTKLSAPTNYVKPKKPKTGGRKKGSVNKRTIEKIAAAQREVTAAFRGKKLAIDHMDEMIDYFRSLVALHQPWNTDGSKIDGKDQAMWFRCVEVFRDFIALRAPYQSPRLSHVSVMPQQTQQRTVVNVTILNERGEQVYSDTPGDDAKLIEGKDEEAA